MSFYKKFEDNWVYKYYNSIKDNEYVIFNGDKATMESIRTSIRVMIISSLVTLFLLYLLYPAGVFSAWIFFVAYYYKSGVERKMTRGYPYLEHTDAIGFFLVGFVSFLVTVVLFFLIA